MRSWYKLHEAHEEYIEETLNRNDTHLYESRPDLVRFFYDNHPEEFAKGLYCTTDFDKNWLQTHSWYLISPTLAEYLIEDGETVLKFQENYLWCYDTRRHIQYVKSIRRMETDGII